MVRAKTGTLSGVNTMAGAGHHGRPAAGVRDHGRRRPATADQAHAALDQIAATLAACGC